MNVEKEFNRLMNEHTEIALATSVNQMANVRIVSFYYDSHSKVLYFTTFPGSTKETEFAQNNEIAFSTLPKEGSAHVRAKGIVERSHKTIFDLREGFVNKIPSYQMIIEKFGEQVHLYEIKFSQANVILTIGVSDTLKL